MTQMGYPQIAQITQIPFGGRQEASGSAKKKKFALCDQ